MNISVNEITKENFAEFGDFVVACDNRKPYDNTDAKLDLSRGEPRLYIMELDYKVLEFSKISRHVNCSQCLGSVDSQSWYIAVCPANNSVIKPDLSKI